jgi:CheY-like chemotaxis protein
MENRLEKTLNVLVVDDLSRNLENAKRIFNSLNNRREVLDEKCSVAGEFRSLRKAIEYFKIPNYKFDADLAKTGKEALELMENTNYEIILSDLFFDYEEGKTTDFIRNEVKNLLSGYGVINYESLSEEDRSFILSQGNDYIEPSKVWSEGSHAPPTGIYLAEKALQKNPNVTFVVNTSVNHHQSLGEPPSRWIRYQNNKGSKLKYVDSEFSKLIFHESNTEEQRKNWQHLWEFKDYPEMVKDWKGALSEALVLLNEKK